MINIDAYHKVLAIRTKELNSTVVICHVRVSMLPLGHAESIAQAKGVYDGTADCGTCAGGY
jgi:hypothetical protein